MRNYATDGTSPRCGVALVTGGCGFIGTWLVRRLVLEGYRVKVLDDLSTGADSIGGIPHVELIRGCVTDGDLVARTCEGAELVFHLAGVVGQRLVTARPGWTYAVSVHGTRNVLRNASAALVCLFSSSAVYGWRSAHVNEAMPVRRASCLEYDGGTLGYASGKMAVERLGCTAARNGCKVLVVRPFNVVGTGQPSAYGMVLPRFIEAARCGRPLTIYDDGRQRRAFSDVGTFVDCVFRLVQRARSRPLPQQVVNIGAPRSTSIVDLATIVEQEIGRPLERQFVPYRSVYPNKTDVRDRTPSTRMLDSIIGRIDWPDPAAIVRRMVWGAAPSPDLREPLSAAPQRLKA